MAFKIFFSYAHKDEQLLEKLEEHLAPLKNQGLIDRGWQFREISAGTEWEPEIIRHLDTADLILLLVSAAFMNSDYCYGKELQRAIARHDRREARVIPIIISPVDWQIPPLDRLQALPTDGRPITGAGWHSVDEALLNVVKGIRSAIKDLQNRPRSGSAYQYQITYINEQVKRGSTAMAALNQCDPELGKLVEWVMNASYYKSDAAMLQAQIEKLLQEISAVGDCDLCVAAEVTPDTLGVLADSFNYMIEQLTKIVVHVRKTTSQTMQDSKNTLAVLEKQKQIAIKLAQALEGLRKSLPIEGYSHQFSVITTLMSDLFRRFDGIEQDIKVIEKSAFGLQDSVGMFHVAEEFREE